LGWGWFGAAEVVVGLVGWGVFAEVKIEGIDGETVANLRIAGGDFGIEFG